jgi:hypothetical protein
MKDPGLHQDPVERANPQSVLYHDSGAAFPGTVHMKEVVAARTKAALKMIAQLRFTDLKTLGIASGQTVFRLYLAGLLQV